MELPNVACFPKPTQKARWRTRTGPPSISSLTLATLRTHTLFLLDLARMQTCMPSEEDLLGTDSFDAFRIHTILVTPTIVGPVTPFIVNYSAIVGFVVRGAHFEVMIQRTIRRHPREKFVTAG